MSSRGRASGVSNKQQTDNKVAVLSALRATRAGLTKLSSTSAPPPTNAASDKRLLPASLTCEDSVLLAGLAPADFERGVQDLGEAQVTHGARGWTGGTNQSNERGRRANETLAADSSTIR